jgi:hypothetical protein
LSDRLSLLTRAVESLFKKHFCSRLSQINSISLAQSCDPGEIEYTRLGGNHPLPLAGCKHGKGPYVAETIAVSVESDYLVVDL